MNDPRANRFVRSHLKMRHLLLLDELGRHMSILGAAQTANLTQPAASRLLGELEHALGIPLFTRLPRGVEPTRYGEVLIRRAGAALAELNGAHQEVLALRSGLSGRVCVGTVMTPSTGWLPTAIRLLRQTHAGIQVSIVVETSRQLVRRLRSGELDIVIGRIPDAESGEELKFEPVADEPHSLAVRPGHPLLVRDDLRIQDLALEAWIMPPDGSMLRDRLTAFFLSAGVDPPAQTIETSSLPVVAELLRGSDMIAALSDELVQPYLDSGLLKVLPFGAGLHMDIYGIVTRKRHPLSPSAETALTSLRQAAWERHGRHRRSPAPPSPVRP